MTDPFPPPEPDPATALPCPCMVDGKPCEEMLSPEGLRLLEEITQATTDTHDP